MNIIVIFDGDIWSTEVKVNFFIGNFIGLLTDVVQGMIKEGGPTY